MKTTNRFENRLFENTDAYLLTHDELHRRYNELIERGVDAIAAATVGGRLSFVLAGVRLCFATGMQIIDDGLSSFGRALVSPPVAQPAFAMRGVRGGATRSEECGASGVTYRAMQAGAGCAGRLAVGADPVKPERLRLALEFLTLDGAPTAPFLVTVRDASGQARLDRRRCDDLTFVIANVTPADLSFRLENDSGNKWVEFSIEAKDSK